MYGSCEEQTFVSEFRTTYKNVLYFDETRQNVELETASIAEPLQNRQHAQTHQRCQHECWYNSVLFLIILLIVHTVLDEKARRRGQGKKVGKRREGENRREIRKGKESAGMGKWTKLAKTEGQEGERKVDEHNAREERGEWGEERKMMEVEGKQMRKMG